MDDVLQTAASFQNQDKTAASPRLKIEKLLFFRSLCRTFSYPEHFHIQIRMVLKIRHTAARYVVQRTWKPANLAIALKVPKFYIEIEAPFHASVFEELNNLFLRHKSKPNPETYL